MNPTITASTRCPANMLARRRTANTECAGSDSPGTSMTKSIGMRKMASTPGNSMCGTMPVQNFTAPYFCIPAPITTRNVASGHGGGHGQRSGRRSGPGEQSHQIAEEDEEEHRPDEGQEAVGVVAADGRPGDLVAKEDQDCFEQISQPTVERFARVRMRRANGTNTRTINSATATSRTMNLVNWRPKITGRSMR